MEKVLLVIVTTALTVACQGVSTGPDTRSSVAVAITFDPTTELEPPAQGSDDGSPLQRGESWGVFRAECKVAAIEKILPKLLPGDAFYISSISRNSLQTAQPISLELPPARNIKEKQTFLTQRGNATKRVGDWFDAIGDNPPCANTKTLCSDIFGSITASANFLIKSKASRKVLFAFTDGQDNITRAGSFPSKAFQNIDVVVLYAFPVSRFPKDYEPFRERLLDVFSTGTPRSVQVLFPVEARSFDFEKYVNEIRRVP